MLSGRLAWLCELSLKTKEYSVSGLFFDCSSLIVLLFVLTGVCLYSMQNYVLIMSLLLLLRLCCGSRTIHCRTVYCISSEWNNKMTTDAVFFPLDTTFGCTLGLLHLYTDTCIWMQVFGCMWVRHRARWLQKQPWDPLEFSQNVSFSWFLHIKLLIGLEVLARISDIQISAGYIVPEMTSCGQSWELRWPLVLKVAGATCSCHTWVLDSKKKVHFLCFDRTHSFPLFPVFVQSLPGNKFTERNNKMCHSWSPFKLTRGFLKWPIGLGVTETKWRHLPFVFVETLTEVKRDKCYCVSGTVFLLFHKMPAVA